MKTDRISIIVLALLLFVAIMPKSCAQVMLPHRRPANTIPLLSPPIDVLSNPPWSGYSVTRKLWSGYAGSAYNVMRSDGTAQDIGFLANGTVDTNSMISFVGSGYGLVQYLYDQSGNGHTMVSQSSTNKWMMVATNGVVNVDANSRPVGWLRNDQNVTVVEAGTFPAAASNSIAIVTTPLAVGGARSAIVNLGSFSQGAINFNPPGGYLSIENGGTAQYNGVYIGFTSQIAAYAIFRNPGSDILSINGQSTVAAAGDSSGGSVVDIGYNGNEFTAMQHFSEVLFFDYEIDTNSLVALLDNQTEYYNFTLPAPVPPDNTLILNYAFTEGSGTSVADSSGNGYTGTITGATWTTGKSGSGFALQFDGINDSLATASVTFGASVITMCGWLYWDAFADDNKIAWIGSGYASTHSFLFQPDESSTGRAQAVINGAGGYRAESYSRWTAAQWTHIAIVYDNSTVTGDIKAFVNGVLQSTTIDVSNKTLSANFAAQTIKIFSNIAQTDLFGAGRLDDFRIYSGELTPPEIAYVMDDAQ